MTTDLATPTRRARLARVGQRQPLALIALGTLLYGVGPVLAGAAAASGAVFSFWRLWFGAPILGLATLLHLRTGGGRPDRSGLQWPLWAGLAFAVHQLLFFTAIKRAGVTDVTLVSTVAPLIVAIAALPLFGERARPRFFAWTALAMAGAAIVALGAGGGPDGDPFGMLLALANVFAFSAFFLVSKQGRDHIDVVPFLFGTMLVAALAVTVFVALTGTDVAAVVPRDLLLAFVLAAGPGAVGHFAMTWPLRWVAVSIPPVVKLAQPVLSGALAFVFLGEVITAAHLAGGALTLAGVCGAVLSRPSRVRADADAPPNELD